MAARSVVTKSELFSLKFNQEKKKKFKDYLGDDNEYIPDLDTLLLGKKSDKESDLSSEIVPSLLTSFLLTKDTKLESRILDIIMRIFNQRGELIDALQKLEILFEPAQQISYLFVEKQSARLKFLTERMEIWLSNYIEDEEQVEDIQEAIEIIENLTQLLDHHYEVQNDTVVINNSSKKGISHSRQNIMKYLETHIPLLTLSKDGLHYLNKIILDQSVSNTIK